MTFITKVFSNVEFFDLAVEQNLYPLVCKINKKCLLELMIDTFSLFYKPGG